MLKFQFIALCAFMGLFLVSCGEDVSYSDECGPLKEFSVDAAYCQKYDLQEETFSLMYPSDLDIETQEDYPSPNYVGFFKYGEDSALIEGVNIGYYYGLSESGVGSLVGGLLGLTKESLLNNMMNQLSAQGFEFEDLTIDDEEMMGEEYFTARARFEFEEETYGYQGKYLIQLVMVPTESDHGLLFIMAAREDSGITTFAEFETKGCSYPILKTLK